MNKRQQEVVADISHNVHVAAGAGTGKTTTLTARYLQILEANAQDPSFGLQNILAITFTKAAALEMRTRIRGKIYEKIASLTEKKDKERWADFLSQFDRAQIMTIDSLQGRILRDHPVEAGVNPDYQILEEEAEKRELGKLTRSFLRAQGDNEDVDALLQEYSLSKIRESLQDLLGKDKPQLLAIDKEILLRNQEGGEKVRAEHWLNLYRQYAAFVENKKDQADLLGFKDVARRALQLLKTNGEIRHLYQEQFRYIMVDEFQDTNAAQRELVYLLCGDGFGDENISLTGQKLFIVGDEKQSIYRFRGAEVSVFQDVCAQMDEQGGHQYHLTENYRSTPQMINFVNQIFGEQGMQLPNYIPLELPADKENKDGPLPIMVKYLRSKDYKSSKVEECSLEAAAVADYIGDLLQKGGESLHSQDVAILLPTMTNVNFLRDALQKKGLHYVVIGGKDFYRGQEVRDLLNVFRFLADSSNDIALLGLLRSPYFGWNDREITEFCHKAGDESLYSCLQKTDGGSPWKYQRTLRLLEELVANASLLPAGELWQKILEVLNVEYTLKVQKQGDQQWANIRKLQSLCLNYCQNQGCGLQGWLEFVEEMVEKSKETEADLPAASAIRIMTIHKSKGLQFNTVVLPFLDRLPKNDTDILKFNVEEAEFGANGSGDGKGTEFSKIKDRNALAEMEERKRLFYVALTRAEERLYLSGWSKIEEPESAEPKKAKKKGKKGKSEELSPEEPKNESKNIVKSLWDMAQYGGEKAELRSGEINWSLGTDVNTGEIVLPKLKTCPFPEAAVPPREYFTPSMLQTYLHCRRQYYYAYVCGLPMVEEEIFAEQPILGDATAGSNEVGADLTPAEQGNLVHTALEYYYGKEEEAFRKAVQKCNMQGRAVDKAQKMFHNYIRSPLFQTINPDHRRELKFQLPLDGTIAFGGVIDCLYKKKDGTYGIVDYKTGPVPASMNEGYAMQLAIYARAVERMRLGKVSSMALHYLQGCQEVPAGGFTAEAGDDKYQEAWQLAREMQGKTGEGEFACTENVGTCEYCGFKYLCRRDKK